MLSYCSKLLLVVILGLTHSEQLHAQPLVASAESIEATVINADLVFVAMIDKIHAETQVDGQEVHNTSISIEKVLKQEPENDVPYTRLQMKIPRSLAVLKDWQQRSARLLIAYESFAPYATKVIELVPGKMEILKSDFTLLREPKEVIVAAEEALSATPISIKRLHTFRLTVPRERFADTSWSEYHGLLLHVPVNQQLEQYALKSLESESYWLREDAVRALRYFPSDTNIARVKKLLNDPGWGYFRHPQENNGVGIRHYGVRKGAYQTLKAWGVNVDKPTIREKFRKPAK